MTGNKIPKHWQKASLGKILTISSGNGLTKSKRNDEGEYLVYGGNGVTGKHSEFLFEEEKLIIGRVGVHCGNAYITKPKSWVTDNAFVVSFDETEININFLLNLIGILNLNKYSVSTAQPVISQGKLYPIEVAIPPLLEQQAIVAKIEELLSELENGKQQLQTAQQQLKMYRQSLLKWAFEGKLTNKKVKDGELPKGWKLKELKEITSVLGDGLHGTPKYSETGDYYFINGNNLNDGKIEIKENTKRVSLEEYNKYKKPLNENTIFVSINGSLGYTAFYNNEKVILGKSACYFNVLETINKFYIRYFLTSSRFNSYANKNATGSTIKNVGLKTMRELQIPIPPTPAEQQLIVDELESKLTVCDKIEETISQSLQQAETLKQSILKQAFEGKLI
jgi:type I restriction enzyme, S subunit